MKRKDRTDKTSIFISKDENYSQFKEIIKSKGLTIQGVFDNFIKKIATGKIDVFDVIKD